MDEKVLLIDGNSIMNRAFFGIRELTNSEGLHTNAIFGFLNILFRTLEEEKPTHIAVAFDLKAPTFRHIKYEAYKGNRKGMPDELREQMPLIKEILKDMQIAICEVEGFEADDILGTLATKSAQLQKAVTVLSGDRDMLQLASSTIKISIPKTKGGTTTTEHYYEKDVIDLYGVTPTEFIDVKGLMGDTSDNIPGVPGIGEKTAIKMIMDFHSIENAYANLELLPPKVATKLQENYALALLSKELATICIDCTTPIEIEACRIKDMYNQTVYGTFKRLEFKSFIDRFPFEAPQLNENKRCVTHMITETTQLEDLFKSEKAVSYFLLEDYGTIHLALTIDAENIYYTNSLLLKLKDIEAYLKGLLLDECRTKVTHNLKEQLHLLQLDLPTSNKSIYDLALAYYLINPVKDTYGIDDIANEMLQISVRSFEEFAGKGKSKKQLLELSNEDVIQYLTTGASILHNGFDVIYNHLLKDDLLDLYFNIELPLLYVLKNMESLGVKVDAYGLKEYGNKLHAKILELEKNIYEAADETFNINSPKQLGVILFEKLKLPSYKKTKTSYSTAADVLEKLENQHPIVKDILTYRTLTKLKSTYADGLFGYIKEGRIHSTFNQKIAATGRISSTDPNLQNIPIRLEIGREIRKVFIPKEDHVFIDADYSQIELRLLAHLSEDETFIEAFIKNLDIHTMTASQVFHVPYEEVTSLQRRNAKAVNFGIVYGISAFGLSQDLNIFRQEASDYIEQYFAKYPRVKSFLDQTIESAKEKGYVKTMYNRMRKIPELSSSNFTVRSFGERVAMNTPIQGSAADIIKIAMINVYNRLNEEGLKSVLVLTVHDELVVETHKDEIDVVKKLLIEEMENAVQLKVPLTVDAHVGNNWYEAK